MKLTNDDILCVLYAAKSNFITDRNLINYPCGMCFYLQLYLNIKFDIYVYYSEIKDIIPEFIPETFGLNVECNRFWWNIKDTDSRIKAFNKLIEIYENK